jgi:hypothetical protein
MPRAHRLQNQAARPADPAPHWADYRTPVKGLYSCGSSAHPGGGVGGVIGHLARARYCAIAGIDDACFSSMPGSRQSAPVRLAAHKFHIY